MACNYCIKWGRPCTWTLVIPKRGWQHPPAFFVSKPPMTYDIFDAPPRESRQLNNQGLIIDPASIPDTTGTTDDSEEETESEETDSE